MTYEGSRLPSGDNIGNTDLADRRCILLSSRALQYFRRPTVAVSDFPGRSKEPSNPTELVDLNDAIAAEFNLGPKASALAEQVMRLIAEQPGGFAGFLEKLREYGEAHVAPGLGRADLPLTVRQVKKLAGTQFIKEVAKYLEIPQGFASKVLGVLLPKIVGFLAAQNVSPGGVSPDTRVFPALALGHLRGRAHDQSVSIKEQMPLLRMDVRYLRFIVPTLLITGGLLGYAISPNTANSAAAGLVNRANTAAVTCSLASRFETHEIASDFAVRAGWIKNLAAEFDSYDSGNPKSPVAGNTLTLKRTTRSARFKIQRKGRSGHESKS